MMQESAARRHLIEYAEKNKYRMTKAERAAHKTALKALETVIKCKERRYKMKQEEALFIRCPECGIETEADKITCPACGEVLPLPEEDCAACKIDFGGKS